MALIHVKTSDFEEKVLKSPVPVLVDFWASWCGPCRMLAPTIDEIAAEQDGKIVVAKIDVDESPELAVQFNVASIPTLIVFKDGKPVNMAVGVRPKAAILAMTE